MPLLYIRIVLDSFYLQIFYSEKFSTWIWRSPFAVNVTLNLSIGELEQQGRPQRTRYLK